MATQEFENLNKKLGEVVVDAGTETAKARGREAANGPARGLRRQRKGRRPSDRAAAFS